MTSSLANSDPLGPLQFRVDPHMLEDLGLNLYTNLPRVLVEFIANAYDADAKTASVGIDFRKINNRRTAMRREWKEELQAVDGDTTRITALEERLLDDDIEISIQDSGHGMSRVDLEAKFLVAGRRRRTEDGTTTSPGGRVLMGRKGVGKLAGFGVARRIEVVTKTHNEDRAYGVRLDFDDIMRSRNTSEVRVPAFHLPDDGGLGSHGTRVTLSKLVHESVKSREQTVRHAIGDHFVLISEADFEIRLNDCMAFPTPRQHAYAWPQPEMATDELVEHEIAAEETGEKVKFEYRLRFVEDRAALRASERGVRVYAHRRLAAAPSLLHADTNMHGFRMTDYLDGVMHADFLDDSDRDYIATDRQGLRWETPLLQPVHEFLSDQIKEACAKYQAFRDRKKREEVERDEFTVNLIADAQLSARERRLANAICTRLASFHGQGVQTEAYREHARLLVQAVGQGEIFSAITQIADSGDAQFQDLVAEVARLTYAEIDHAVAWMRSRLVAIEALRKLVVQTDFGEANNERALHDLLKTSPWLIDATYFEFLTSDQSEQTLFGRLERKLGIGEWWRQQHEAAATEQSVAGTAGDRRPDLVFLLGNEGLRRVVIVELKAPNTPLLHRHLLQLTDYLRDTREFLRGKVNGEVSVEGCLIGTLELTGSSTEIRRLDEEIEARGPTAKWAVYDLNVLLERTLSAHRDFLRQHGTEVAPRAAGG